PAPRCRSFAYSLSRGHGRADRLRRLERSVEPDRFGIERHKRDRDGIEPGAHGRLRVRRRDRGHRHEHQLGPPRAGTRQSPLAWVSDSAPATSIRSLSKLGPPASTSGSSDTSTATSRRRRARLCVESRASGSPRRCVTSRARAASPSAAAISRYSVNAPSNWGLLDRRLRRAGAAAARGDRADRRALAASLGGIAEARLALLEVGAHRLALILPARQRDLQLGLETQAVGDAAEQRGVEQLLRRAHGVGAALRDLA